ncbi:MAG: tetratricopeptide repeat protein [Bacillota bacterium]|nr:tetratricopeptide repeat protein [Bacillota bacterium]
MKLKAATWSAKKASRRSVGKEKGMRFLDRLFREGKAETKEYSTGDVFGHLAPKAEELLERARRGGRISFAEYLPLMEMAESHWLGAGRKDHSRAAAAYSILIEIAPDDVQRSAAHGCRGRQFEEMGAADRAIDDTTRAIDLLKACGGGAFERLAYALYEHLGRQNEKKGDLRGAITAYQEIPKAYPRYRSVAEKVRELEARYHKARNSA